MAKYIVELEVDEEICKANAEEGGYENPTTQQAVEAELAWAVESGISVISVNKKDQ